MMLLVRQKKHSMTCELIFMHQLLPCGVKYIRTLLSKNKGLLWGKRQVRGGG